MNSIFLSLRGYGFVFKLTVRQLTVSKDKEKLRSWLSMIAQSSILSRNALSQPALIDEHWQLQVVARLATRSGRLQLVVLTPLEAFGPPELQMDSLAP